MKDMKGWLLVNPNACHNIKTVLCLTQRLKGREDISVSEMVVCSLVIHFLTMKVMKGCYINALSRFRNLSKVLSGYYGQCQSYPFRELSCFSWQKINHEIH
jgi:hypothetical protein